MKHSQTNTEYTTINNIKFNYYLHFISINDKNKYLLRKAAATNKAFAGRKLKAVWGPPQKLPSISSLNLRKHLYIVFLFFHRFCFPTKLAVELKTTRTLHYQCM